MAAVACWDRRAAASYGPRVPSTNLLANRLYLGEVAHKGAVYAGEHEAIIDRATWGKVRAIMAEPAHRRVPATRA